MKFAILLSAVSLLCSFLPFVSAAKCEEICPDYYTWPGPIADPEKREWHAFANHGECSVISDQCGDAPTYILRDDPGYVTKRGPCTAWCKCNVFGWNCDTCGPCMVYHRLLEEKENNVCSDYEEYRALPLDEKYKQLQPGLYAGVSDDEEGKYEMYDKAAIIFAVEMAMDTDGDGTMSCTEFNNAHGVKEVAEFVGSYLGLPHD
jgi:hypothetical protein